MNDERPIEKLLRRYARKRRDEAPDAPGFDLHPATHRLLHGEVARQFPKTARVGGASPSRLLRVWWPRLIWITPVLLVVAVGVWWLVESRRPAGDMFQMAQSPSAPTELAKAEPAPKPAASMRSPATESKASPASPQTSATGLAKTVTDGDVKIAGVRESSKVATETDAARPGLFDDRTSAGYLAANRPAALRESRADDLAQKNTEQTRDAAAALASRALAETPTSPAAAPAPAPASQQTGATIRSGPQPTAGEYFLARQGVDGPAFGRSLTNGVALAAKSPGAQPSPGKSAVQTSPSSEGRFLGEAGPVYSQSFANLDASEAGAKKTKAGDVSPVLANFQVQQAGNDLRVIDSDGSVYLGDAESQPVKDASGAAFEQRSKEDLKRKDESTIAVRRYSVAPVAGERQAQNQVYRVAGTNRTLNQQVVFTWNFVALSNTPADAQNQTALAPKLVDKNARHPSQVPVALQNSAITGRAQLGPDRQFQINAVPLRSEK